MGFVRRLSVPSTSLLCFGVIGVVGAWGYTSYLASTRFDGTENYSIDYSKNFKGWAPMPKTPESLFIFENLKKGYILRGSVSQVISDVNPTPDLTTDSMAQFYIDRTRENMPNWTAERVQDLNGKNVRFSLIERKQKDHTVLTAFTVKGNTTFMVSLSARSGDPVVVKDAINNLTDYVKSIALNQSDMGGGKKAVAEASANPLAMQ